MCFCSCYDNRGPTIFIERMTTATEGSTLDAAVKLSRNALISFAAVSFWRIAVLALKKTD